jgi:transcription-repair coupling factor (superfamily II helicase)
MLPDGYVSSTEERLSLYQKLAEIENHEELNKFEFELTDRFGALPEEAINLLKSVELKWLAAAIGFEKIVMKNGIFLGYFPDNPQDKFYQSEKFRHLLNYLTKNPQEATLKEKNNQLMMRKEKVTSIEAVNGLLSRILVKEE